MNMGQQWNGFGDTEDFFFETFQLFYLFIMHKQTKAAARKKTKK